MKQFTGLEIAVIGMSGRFPGASDIHAFWENLKNGVESISVLTDEELAEEIGPDRSLMGNPNYVKASSFLKDKEYFDSAFFNCLPDEAMLMDPQMRLFHECVWSAIEDAGCNLERDKVGLFAGAGINTNWEVYCQLINQGLVDDFSASQLYNARFLASRLSYLLNLRGPSVFVDTACSTSLVAIHQACRSLLVGDCNVAVAGGVTITNRSRKGYLYEEGMIHSRDGHCRTFDADASGTVTGEGTAVVVLKTLKNALKDSDHIYAIIKGGGVNNDGNNKVGYTAPGVDGQTEAIMMAHRWSKVPPESISYVEAHGTGTRLGDPIEVEALNRAFGKSQEKYCGLGSVKTNIGHLDAAAGVAGFIKTVLALKHRQIPPSLHFKNANPKIDFSGSPFYVNTELRPWVNAKYPLRAGVSSFGIGGTNAHVILEEAPEQEATSGSRPYQLLLFSGKTPSSLERNIENFLSYVSGEKTLNLADAAYTLQTGRSGFSFRQAIVCANAVENAVQVLSGERKSPSPLGEKQPSPVVFMFSGQGSQYVNMFRDLYAGESFFRSVSDSCFDIVKGFCGRDLRSVVFNEGSLNESLDETGNTQPCLFIIEYSLSRLLMQWGISPDMMIGHSIGEYVAACLSGVFSLEDALYLVTERGRLMQQARRGKMLSLSISREELESLLSEHRDISLAAVNSPSSCVVSGEAEAINAFKVLADALGYATKVLRTSHGFHSYMMDEILVEFEEVVKKVSMHRPQVSFISNLSGEEATYGEVSSVSYWVRHLRETVQFSLGIETLLRKKEWIFVEVGPGRSLSTFVQSHGSRKPGDKALSLGRSSQDKVNDLQHLLRGVGALWSHGLNVSWASFYEHESRRKISLPTYSFDKIKYPVHVDAYKMITDMMGSRQQKEKELGKWLYRPSWKLLDEGKVGNEKVDGVTLLLCDSLGLGSSLAGKLRNSGELVVMVELGSSFESSVDFQYKIDADSLLDYDRLFSHLSREGRLPSRIIHCWSVSAAGEVGYTAESCALYFYSLVEIIKSCSVYGGLQDKTFIVISNDQYDILDRGNVSGVKSMLPALLTVLSQEHPGVRTRSIDISLKEFSEGSLTELLYRELQVAGRGDVLSLRHGRRWSKMYDRVQVSSPTASVLKAGGVYLLTGGLGALGFHVSRYLLRTYQARVVLVGQTPLPVDGQGRSEYMSSGSGPEKEKLNRLMQLESEAQGSVLYMSCDISEPGALAEVVRQSEARFGRIHGVIHAAGTVSGSSINTLVKLGRADYQHQFKSKVMGLESLREVFEDRGLDFCMLTSSLSSILGGLGFGAYASGNAFMDHYVQGYRAQGRLQNWMSVDMDGLNFGGGETEVIGGEELLSLLPYLLSVLHQGQVIVSPTDLQWRLDRWVYGQDLDKVHASASELEVGRVEAQLVGAAEPEEKMLHVWRSFFGRMEITAEDDFFEIGGDSLKALTIISRMHKALNVEIPIAELFARPSVKQLTEYITALKKDAESDGKASGRLS